MKKFKTLGYVLSLALDDNAYRMWKEGRWR